LKRITFGHSAPTACAVGYYSVAPLGLKKLRNNSKTVGEF